MSDYIETVRSTDFLVNDKVKATKILSSIVTDGELYYDVEDTDTENVYKCWFGAYGGISGLYSNYDSDEDDGEDDMDADYALFVSELQSILLEDSYINIIDVGNEKLRYVGGGCLVITKNDSEYINIIEEGHRLAKVLLSEGSTKGDA